MDSATRVAPMDGQASTIAVVQGATPAAPTLLGRAAPRIPVAGRIRAGIKVLTRRAAENEDFPNPEIARQIVDRFAEDRGDGVRRLYRFPVVFPADAWQSVMPHELVAWTANERRFWSEYSADGQTRYCTTHAPVPVDGGTRRVIRLWGGRKTMRRAENDGLCDPESCPEYQDRRCNLSGHFIFFIPAIESISAFELPTNSFYAMNAAIQKFQTIAFRRGGRISGFLDNKHTPFYLSKRLVDVARIDDEGRAVRTSQWLIELEAPVDVAALLRPDDDLDAAEVRAAEAAGLLEGLPAECNVADDPSTGDEEPMRVRAHDSERNSGPESVSAPEPAPEAEPEPKATPVPRIRSTAKSASPEPHKLGASAAAADARQVFEAAAELGVEADRFEDFAQKRWGRGWKLNANGRRRALDEVSSFSDDAAGFRAKVESTSFASTVCWRRADRSTTSPD